MGRGQSAESHRHRYGSGSVGGAHLGDGWYRDVHCHDAVQRSSAMDQHLRVGEADRHRCAMQTYRSEMGMPSEVGQD